MDIFEKKRQLAFPNDNFRLPPVTSFFQQQKWIIPELLVMKDDLNETKSLLDHFELNNWHRHTRQMNPAGFVIKFLKPNFNPEYCSVAWCKFTECLVAYDVVPRAVKAFIREGYSTEVNSLHLCEAPGAFVSATNHYMYTHFPSVQWDWIGTTLSPYHEGNDGSAMINEDKLILCSWDKWTFLSDQTGNILRTQNVLHLVKQVRTRPGIIHFVTADGSIDCQLNPGEQEGTVAQLHLAEILTALHTLTSGGSFVIKIFTFLECKTVCHLYLLAATFKEVHLFKPCMSKEGNSEVYVICTGYKGFQGLEEPLRFLVNILETENDDMALFPLSTLPSAFLKRIREAACYFTGLQIDVIRKNIRTFELPKQHHLVRSIKVNVTAEFQRRYDVQPLPVGRSLFSNNGHRIISNSAHVDPRSGLGTFFERASRKTLDLPDLLDVIELEVMELTYNHSRRRMMNLRVRPGALTAATQRGKAYRNILSSRWCFGKLLSLRQELREGLSALHATQPFPPTSRLGSHTCDSTTNLFKGLSAVHNLNINDLNGKTSAYCFHEVSSTFVRRSDMEVTVKRLGGLMDRLLNIRKSGNLFLCEFPALTRVHVGFLHVLAELFYRVHVEFNLHDKIRGVLLLGFKGWTGLENFREALVQLIADISRAGPEEAILEIMLMQPIYLSPLSVGLVSYNAVNVGETLNEIIHEARALLQV